MAYIQPNSTILILKNVPLEPDYEHTVNTANNSAQYSAFASFVKYTLSANTYQRVNRNMCRVGIVADNLYDCNYMMFQNTNFGSKWFYAFITSVEYINNECSEITYEIDVMQTYAHDYSVGYCFVEREHSVSDALFENFVPEEINYGDIVYDTGLHRSGQMNNINIYILAVNHQSPYHDIGSVVEGVFTGGTLYAWTTDGSTSSLNNVRTSIRAFLNDYENVPENIIAIWSGPALGTDYTTNHLVGNARMGSAEFVGAPITGTETFGGFTPRNKKLYCYPYNFYVVTDGNSTLNLHYEYFKSGNVRIGPKFDINANMMPTPEAICRPVAYKGTGDFNDIGDLPESITISGWGVGSWTNNTWSQLVTAKTRDFIGTIINPQNIIAPRYGLMNSANAIGQIEGALIKKDLTPSLTYGNSHSGGALAGNYQLDFYHGRARITEEFARIIDNYFDVYGYQTNKIKIPNTNSRPYWNYVKTSNCELVALTTMPADDAAKIKANFNKGITFWQSIQNVGMYNKDNRPTP